METAHVAYEICAWLCIRVEIYLQVPTVRIEWGQVFRVSQKI